MSSRRIEFFDGFTSETTPTTEVAQGPIGTALPLLQAKYTLGTASALTFTGTYYTLPLNTTEFQDTGYSNASGVITVTEAGRYNINARAVIGTAVLERIDGYIQIYKNGTTVVYSCPITSYMNLSDGNAFNINNVLTLAANDTIQIRVQIDSHWGASFDPVFSTASYVVIKRDEGLKGDTGPDGLDGVNWQGTWVSGNYTEKQAVEYNGSSYVCHTDTVSNEVPTNTSYWNILAVKGTDGASGTNGVDGIGGTLDSFYAENFEGAIGAADFTTGNNTSFDNGGVIAGTLSDDVTTEISGTQSLKYVQAVGSLNDWVKSPDITISKKHQGNTNGAIINYTYDGDDNDIQVVLYDDTGSEVLTNTTQVFKSSSSNQRLTVQFPVGVSAVTLNWGIKVLVENTGAILVIDDVELTTNPFMNKDTQGENRFSGVIANLAGTASITSQGGLDELDANAIASVNRTAIGRVTITWTTGFFTVAPSVTATCVQGTSGASQHGAEVTSTSTTATLIETHAIGTESTFADLSFNIKIDRQEADYRQPTKNIVAYNSRNASNSMVRLHTANGHGSSSTAIRRFTTTVDNIGNAITYNDSSTLGGTFTIEEDGIYNISFSDTANNLSYIGISLNTTQLTTAIVSLTNAEERLSASVTYAANIMETISWAGQLNKGDVIRAHTEGRPDGTSLDRTTFTIAKIGVGDLLGVPLAQDLIAMTGLPIYADEAAAIAGGLDTDRVYKTATGELRIKL